MTPEEKERYSKIRQQVELDLPELQQWAREAAARRQDHVAVGTVLAGEDAKILEAMDAYAAKHSLPGRSAVVRVTLARLLGIEIARR